MCIDVTESGGDILVPLNSFDHKSPKSMIIWWLKHIIWSFCYIEPRYYAEKLK